MSNVSGEGPASTDPAAPKQPVSSAPAAPRPKQPPSEPDRLVPAPRAAVATASPDDPAARRRRRLRRAAKAKEKEKTKLPSLAVTTAITAVITAIVGGVLSQDRIDSVFGSDEPSESNTAEMTQAVEYERVTEPVGAIAIDVPESWGVAEAMFSGIGGVDSPGLGLRSGPDPLAVRFVSDETVWVGASTQAFDDLGLEGLDDAAVTDLFESRLESSVYLPRAGCKPTSKHTPELSDDWVGTVQAWQDCSSIDGWRALEVEMVSSDRDVYVYLQIGLAPETPDEVSQRMLDSLDVLPAKLPVS